MKKILFTVFCIITCLLCTFVLISCNANDNHDSKTNKTEGTSQTKSETELNKVTAEGIVVVNNGSYLIIEGESPIQMYTRGDKSIFDGLTTGDVIRIVRDAEVMESFPGQVFIYSLEKLSDGDLYDIPKEMISILSELGWIKERVDSEIENDDSEINQTTVTEKFTYSENGVELSIRVPEGWNCIKYDSDETRHGLIIYPTNSPDDKIEFMYYEGLFATCGTGLTTLKCKLYGKDAKKMFYDERQIWTYIVSEKFVLTNRMNDDVFLQMRDDIELMLDSITFDLTEQ